MISAIIATMAGVAMFYSFYVLKEIKTLDMQVKADNYVGFRLDTDKLYFGTTMPGNDAERGITIFHHYSYPVKVKIYTAGYISKWVTIDNSSFTLLPNETKRVMFRVHVPKDTINGNYTGTVKLVFTRW